MEKKQQTPTNQAIHGETIHEIGLGETIDGFSIVEKITESDVTTVYRVTHPDHPLEMVMKVPKLHRNLPPSTFSGFESEIHILSGMKGPHIPAYIASGDMAECPYLVMEFIDGETLSRATADAPLPTGRIADLIESVCKAVQEMHRQNVIHLDLRPANIRNRVDGTSVIIDFGSAHHAHLPDMYEDAHEDAPHSVAYMAPEQIHHIRSDSRSDLYAIGVILYQLATGKMPFGQSNIYSVKRRIRSAPLPPRALNPEIPPWLQEIIYMCLEVYPDKRYATAQKIAYLLAHPHMVELSNRSHQKKMPGLYSRVGRWLNSLSANIPQHSRLQPVERLSTAPHTLVALDLSHASTELKDAIRDAVRQISQTQRQTFFTCITVITDKRVIDSEDPETIQSGKSPQHVQAQVELRHWIKPLGLSKSQVNFQVYNGDAADVIINYANRHVIDQIIMGARGSGTLHRLLGSVSQKVLAYAPCTVTVVKMRKGITADTGAVGE